MKKIDEVCSLRQKYEIGELKVENMTDVEYKEIEKLYNFEIYQLDNEIKKHEKKIEEYRADILKVKK